MIYYYSISQKQLSILELFYIYNMNNIYVYIYIYMILTIKESAFFPTTIKVYDLFFSQRFNQSVINSNNNESHFKFYIEFLSNFLSITFIDTI